MARSMLALGTPAALAFSMAVRSWKLPAGSAPLRAATMISLPSRVNTAPRLESTTALVRFIWAHLLWPAIGVRGERSEGLAGCVEHQLGLQEAAFTGASHAGQVAIRPQHRHRLSFLQRQPMVKGAAAAPAFKFCIEQLPLG